MRHNQSLEPTLSFALGARSAPLYYRGAGQADDRPSILSRVLSSLGGDMERRFDGVPEHVAGHGIR